MKLNDLYKKIDEIPTDELTERINKLRNLRVKKNSPAPKTNKEIQLSNMLKELSKEQLQELYKKLEEMKCPK